MKKIFTFILVTLSTSLFAFDIQVSVFNQLDYPIDVAFMDPVCHGEPAGFRVESGEHRVSESISTQYFCKDWNTLKIGLSHQEQTLGMVEMHSRAGNINMGGWLKAGQTVTPGIQIYTSPSQREVGFWRNSTQFIVVVY